MSARAAVLALLLATCATAGPPAGAPDGETAARLYVTNQDDATISVIELPAHRVIETVDLRRLGFGASARPHHAQVEWDGSAWYVTLIGEGKVLKLDRRQRPVAAADVEVPGLLALHPTRDLLFVARSMSAVNPPARLAVIRRSDMRLLEEIDLVFPRPHALAVHPTGGSVYVASLGVNQLASIDVEKGDVRLVDVPGPARGFVQAAVSPDGRWLALTAELSGELLVFDLADPAVPNLAHTIPLAAGPFEPVFTSDSRWIYVTNLTANRVSVVDTRTWRVAAEIAHEAFAQPHGVGLSPDGRHVYVSNRHQHGGVHDHAGGRPAGAGSVVAICVSTRLVEAVMPVGAYAAGIGVERRSSGAGAGADAGAGAGAGESARANAASCPPG